ncbi:hypothetical protein AKO1_015717 [Acrasis kona]|uniref:EGF-like domain-containing protein n=1 Tax=Acrasis kona TaxID=1008807 RepID=A0AAW2ZIP7_9EUKA
MCVSAHQCGTNLSGDNNASPARRLRTSSSCLPDANLSGDNNASPARAARTAPVCSGKGGCVNQVCVCNPGFEGENCEYDCTTTTGAPTTTSPPVKLTPRPTTSAPTTAAPTTTTVAPTTVAPTTTSPPVNLTPRPTTSVPITTCPPCPCGTVDANLSGDNNASPARRQRTHCPVCKECTTTSAPTTTTYAPTTSAPTTVAPTTTSPPVNLTPRPTTSVPTPSSPQTSESPKPSLPVCSANLSGDNNASPARRVKSNTCSANLSGDNNASPARRFRKTLTEACNGNGYCSEGSCVCKPGFQGADCEEQCVQVNPCWTCPSGFVHWYETELIKAPGDDRCACVPGSSTSAPTTLPPVQLTPRPTTSAPTTRAPTQNESGDDLSRESNSAVQRSFMIGVLSAIFVAMML